MSKKQIKKIIMFGIICVILLIIGVLYSINFNDSRFVEQMDMSTYVFSIKDLPMILIGMLIAVYIIYITFHIVKAAFNKEQVNKSYTRRISPKLGFLGLFGFLGFLGFWTYSVHSLIYPFIFFIFFGFFGFFFEGKLSGTLEDELYIENKRKAEVQAYKIGFKLLFIVIWLIGIGLMSRNIEWCAVFMLISMSLIYALVLFLSSYLLYRYEKEV